METLTKLSAERKKQLCVRYAEGFIWELSKDVPKLMEFRDKILEIAKQKKLNPEIFEPVIRETLDGHANVYDPRHQTVAEECIKYYINSLREEGFTEEKLEEKFKKPIFLDTSMRTFFLKDEVGPFAEEFLRV